MGGAWLGRLGHQRSGDRGGHGPVRTPASPAGAGHSRRGRGALCPRAPPLGAGPRVGGRPRRPRARLRRTRPAPHRGGGAARQSRLARGVGKDRPRLRARAEPPRETRRLLCAVPRRAPRPRGGRDGGMGRRMTFTLGRKIAIGFSAALVVLVLIGGASFNSLADLALNAQRVEETYQTLQVLE